MNLTLQWTKEVLFLIPGYFKVEYVGRYNGDGKDSE